MNRNKTQIVVPNVNHTIRYCHTTFGERRLCPDTSPAVPHDDNDGPCIYGWSKCPACQALLSKKRIR